MQFGHKSYMQTNRFGNKSKHYQGNHFGHKMMLAKRRSHFEFQGCDGALKSDLERNKTEDPHHYHYQHNHAHR